MLATLRLKIFFHDRCFDGAGATALFGAFYRDVMAPGAELVPAGVTHRDGDPFEGARFDGDDHACVDFRFSPDPAMRWWFDHHRTAFQPTSLRAVFDASDHATRFFDPEAPSCTGLIARVARERWGWTPPPALAELVRWADIIDAAAFASPAEAISLEVPAQRLAVFLGATPDPAEVARYAVELAGGATLAELDAAPWVRAVVEPLRDAREATIARLAGHAHVELGAEGDPRGELVVFDLLDQPDLAGPGFLGYALHPHCRYTVSVTRHHGVIKLAVGHNPWCGVPRAVDVGALCQRFGGGGHAVVGGVTLEAGETERARTTLAALVEGLKQEG